MNRLRTCFSINPKLTVLSGPSCLELVQRAMADSGGGRKLLPSLLPILPVVNRVLLPGARMILEVTDPRGLEIFPAPGGRGR